MEMIYTLKKRIGENMIHETNTFRRDLLSAFAQDFLSEDMLLFDIETTGLSPDRDFIYCIGCGYQNGKDICIELFFAEGPDDEPDVISSFFRLADRHPVLITFNGTTFDLPFIKKRSGECLPKYTDHLDLYQAARGMRQLLGLSSYKQKSVEQFLGCCREDKYTGGELIEFYKEYVKTCDGNLLTPILLHNREDVRGMFDLLDILAYLQFRDGKFEITDMIGEEDGPDRYLNIKICPEKALPQSIHLLADGAAVLLGSETSLVRIPVTHGTLKHFFEDTKNYYYLPEEDEAVHKSVGQYVDASHRSKATRKNCYTKKECDYIALPVKTSYTELKRTFDDRGTCLEIPAEKYDLKAVLIEYFSLFIQ